MLLEVNRKGRLNEKYLFEYGDYAIFSFNSASMIGPIVEAYAIYSVKNGYIGTRLCHITSVKDERGYVMLPNYHNLKPGLHKCIYEIVRLIEAHSIMEI